MLNIEQQLDVYKIGDILLLMKLYGLRKLLMERLLKDMVTIYNMLKKTV